MYSSYNKTLSPRNMFVLRQSVIDSDFLCTLSLEGTWANEMYMDQNLVIVSLFRRQGTVPWDTNWDRLGSGLPVRVYFVTHLLWHFWALKCRNVSFQWKYKKSISTYIKSFDTDCVACAHNYSTFVFSHGGRHFHIKWKNKQIFKQHLHVRYLYNFLNILLGRNQMKYPTAEGTLTYRCIKQGLSFTCSDWYRNCFRMCLMEEFLAHGQKVKQFQQMFLDRLLIKHCLR